MLQCDGDGMIMLSDIVDDVNKKNVKSIKWVSQLENVDHETYKTVIVEDPRRGGVFSYIEANNGINDGGVIFDGWTRHWSGSVNPLWFGAYGDGIHDDSEAMRRALKYTQSLADGIVSLPGDKYPTIDLNGESYKISHTLYINKTIIMQNGELHASSTFPINTSPTEPSAGNGIDIGQEYNFMIVIDGNADGSVLQNLVLHGYIKDPNSAPVGSNTIRGNCILQRRRQVTLRNIHMHYFKWFGLYADMVSECIYNNIHAFQWGYNNYGGLHKSARTAVCLQFGGTNSQNNGDGIISQCVAAFGKIPMRINSWTTLYSQMHPYNGGPGYNGDMSVSTDVKYQTCMEINSQNNTFMNCYFDNGTLSIRNSIQNTFIGCDFLRKPYRAPGETPSSPNNSIIGNTYPIQVYAKKENDTCPGLKFIGCKFENNYHHSGYYHTIKFVEDTSDSNNLKTFVPLQEMDIVWNGNSFNDGYHAWLLEKQGRVRTVYAQHHGGQPDRDPNNYNVNIDFDISSEKNTIGSNKSINIIANADGNAPNTNRTIRLLIGDVHAWQVGSYLDEAKYSLIPGENKSYSLGSNDNMVNNIYLFRPPLTAEVGNNGYYVQQTKLQTLYSKLKDKVRISSNTSGENGRVGFNVNDVRTAFTESGLDIDNFDIIENNNKVRLESLLLLMIAGS